MSKVAWLVGLTCPARQSPNGDPGSQTPSQVESRIAACVAQTGCVAWLFRMRRAEASRASSATMRRAAWPQEIVPRGHQDRHHPQRRRRRVTSLAAPVAFPAFPARLSASVAAGDWRAGCTGWMGSGGVWQSHIVHRSAGQAPPASRAGDRRVPVRASRRRLGVAHAARSSRVRQS